MGLRRMIYLRNEPNNCLTASGINLRMFINCFQDKLDSLLLLEHDFNQVKYNKTLKLDYIAISNEVSNENCILGNLSWVDFKHVTYLDNTPKTAIAELLYFAHMGEPLSKIFISELHNDFAYWSHDDGWYSRIYFKKQHDLQKLLHYIIKQLLSAELRKDIVLPSQDLKSGLLFDRFDNKGDDLRYYVVGRVEDIDEVFANINEIKEGNPVKILKITDDIR